MYWGGDAGNWWVVQGARGFFLESTGSLGGVLGSGCVCWGGSLGARECILGGTGVWEVYMGRYWELEIVHWEAPGSWWVVVRARGMYWEVMGTGECTLGGTRSWWVVLGGQGDTGSYWELGGSPALARHSLYPWGTSCPGSYLA